MRGSTPKKADFAAYLAEWRRAFPRRRGLSWRGSWLANGYCRDCRHCCGPQDEDEPFPMRLLPSQVRPDLDRDFYLLDAGTACLDRRGCLSCTSTGCRLPRERRPVACGLFPFVPTADGMYLYLVCPASLLTPLERLESLGRAAARWFLTLDPSDRRRIALDLPPETLADRYVNLHIPL